MLMKKMTQFVLVASILSSLVLIQAPDASAARRHRGPIRHNRTYFHAYHHPYRGRIVSFPELLASLIVYSGLDYYYYDGYYYQRVPSGYVIVDAPVGITIKALPRGYKTVIFKGVKYYYCNGVYYVKQRNNYIVVDDPIDEVSALPQEVKVISEPVLSMVQAGDDQTSFTVNIPNAKGDYTSVTLEKSKDGFIGPQGEFYSEFPTVAQLKVMYGG